MLSDIRRLQPGERITPEAFNALVETVQSLRRLATSFPLTAHRSPAGLQISLQQQQPPAIDGLPINATDLLALTGASPEELPPWLSTQLGKRLDRLSGGQLQFLYLWSCLLAAADVVLLDEPTNNLDPEGTTFLEGVLRLRADAGCGLLVVSHDQRFINAVCHRKISLG